MSIQDIKNAKLRRAILVVVGPPITILYALSEMTSALVEVVKDAPNAYRDVWNG